MQDFQQRVVDEKAALDDKITKLDTFSQGPVYAGLPEAEQTRLEKQIEFMQLYSDVLGERIAAFGEVKEPIQDCQEHEWSWADAAGQQECKRCGLRSPLSDGAEP